MPPTETPYIRHSVAAQGNFAQTATLHLARCHPASSSVLLLMAFHGVLPERDGQAVEDIALLQHLHQPQQRPSQALHSAGKSGVSSGVAPWWALTAACCAAP